MLVLSRKVGEVIRVGDDVEVTVVRIGPNAVRLGIKAPKTMNIVREELVDDEQLTADPPNCKIQESEDALENIGRRRNSP